METDPSKCVHVWMFHRRDASLREQAIKKESFKSVCFLLNKNAKILKLGGILMDLGRLKSVSNSLKVLLAFSSFFLNVTRFWHYVDGKLVLKQNKVGKRSMATFL